MYLLTCYENGRRYYSAPIPGPAITGTETLVTPSMVVAIKTFEDGAVFTSFQQEITPEEFEQYKKDPLSFTAKTI